jgi:hypothetical protein
MRPNLSRTGAAAAVLLALLAAVALALWPCAYQGIEAQDVTGGAAEQGRVCATMVEANGIGVIGVLAVPVLLAGTGLAAVLAGWRAVQWIVIVVLAAFCLLSLASVGLFYVPTAVALIVATAGGAVRRTSDP